MRIVLDLDDFSDSDTCRTELEALNEYFDSFKVSMFAVPYRTSRSTIRQFAKLGCEFLPHGFEHTHLEMDTMTYEEVTAKLEPVDKLVDAGLLGRVFKAPYWRYSWASYRALVDHGYIVAISREQLRHPAPGIPVYEYDLELDEDWFGSGLETVRLHGHVTPYRNSLDAWYKDLIEKLPADTRFLTVSEYIAEHELAGPTQKNDGVLDHSASEQEEPT